ncbi:hypothetical protein PFFVO_06001, partial [Plasmodium falciparum Vietnam Oak-Knoll (FVO)]
MVPQKPTAEDYSKATSAKEFLDRIGETIQKQAHAAALSRSWSELKGLLSEATYPKDKNPRNTTPEDPCQLNHEYHTNVTSNVIDPCNKRSRERFSDTQGAECDYRKIRDSDKTSNGGACAAYRRLHLCDKNLEQIEPDKITTHNLLADVCQAAKFEGQSIRGYYAQYDEQYPSSGSTICTALARSFADIGDIIRGKDLFIGNNKRDKLEKQLKKYFQKIYDKLKDKEEAKKSYSDTINFFQLREDWWALNRKEVWKAITCDVKSGNNYFRPTCGDALNPSLTQGDCRCPKTSGGKPGKSETDQVPTYFDYVPQYLRWFEEWAEDFCRKRKKKIENAIKNCRYDERGEPKYCDLNGFDCTKTASGEKKFVKGQDCHKCSVACNPFVDWIENKKKEFEKQKNKYADEIKKADVTNGTSKGRTTKETSNGPINNLYVSDFYKTLQDKCGNVNAFLALLSKEQICQSELKVVNETASPVNFTKDEEIFCRTKYCRACPLCGVTGEKGNWEAKGDEKCAKKEEKKYNTKNITKIPVLTPEKVKKGILEKYKNFCKNSDGNNSDQIKNWECYYDESNDDGGKNDNCILGKWESFTGEEDVRSYYSFFYGSIIDMLKDSIDWRERLKKCLQNDNKDCISTCNSNCECYRLWVEKKKEEFEGIKEHFGKQGDLLEDMKNLFLQYTDPGDFLECYLEINFLQDMKDAKGDPKVIEKFKEILGRENEEDMLSCSNEKRIIEEFLQEELDEATKCLGTHTNPCLPKPQDSAGGRSLQPDGRSDPPREEITHHDDDDEDDEDAEEEEEEDTTEETAEDTTEDTEQGPKEDSDRLCDDKKEPKCKGYETYSTNIYEPKINLIGLEAHNRVARTNSNVYMSPRVQQLCLEPLTKLTNSKKKGYHVNANKFSEALQQCAYNEAKSLYEYYKGEGKENIYTKNGIIKEEDIKQHTLEAMKRSYADYGNIVKGDMWWIYPDKKDVDSVIISVADTLNANHKAASVTTDDNDEKRLHLWASIRTNVWKAMVCGYKDAGGSFDNDVLKCNLPDTENTDQFVRWFIEWGENFCIRREQELKRLQEKCENVTCNGTDERKKQECKRLCERYKEFLKNFESQYEKQRILYIELKESISEFKNKDPFMFLKDKCKSKCSCFKDMNENEYNKIFQYPSDEVKMLCTCTSKNTSKTKPTNCIEEAAYELQQNVAKKIGNNSSILKGKEIFLSDCRKGDHIVVHNNSDYTKKIDKDKLEHFFPSNRYSCKRKGTINVNVEEWDCNNTNINFREQHICLPPRRRFMCIKKIDDMMSSTVDDKDKFLEVVMEAAKTEGVRILKNFKSENGTNFSEICHDMKYSFADLGDIIRGRDLWRSNVEEQRIQQKLKTIFRYINDHLVQQNVKKYQSDGGNYYTLRSDWWDANRKSIWKAMTCSTPRSAYIYTNTTTITTLDKDENQNQNRTRLTDMNYYCGYGKEPPYVDYIPQKLRWMTEWSEYFCKALNKKLETFKTVCGKCIQSEKKCHDNNKGKECEKCKEKCSKYKDFVNTWKGQYDLQAKAYEELYKKASGDIGNYISDDDNYVVDFLKEVKTACGEDDTKSAEKYLYKTSNCKHYKFNDESTNSNKTYAFKEQPEGYENHCTCEITHHPLDDCPDDTNKDVCNNLQPINTCKSQIFNNKLHNWNSFSVDDFKGKNEGMLVPPRRRHLCLYNTIINLPSMVHKNDFKKVFLNAVYTEGKLLWDKYGENSNDVMEAMKYSFADYADIIKGTDMLDTTTSKKINKRLLELLNVSNNDRRHATSWWKNNRSHIWHAMLCGYKKANDKFVINSDTCKLPNEDEIPQFLRWLLEWAKQACKENNLRKKDVETKCNCTVNDKKSYLEILENINCKDELIKYVSWINNIKLYYDGLNRKFQRYKELSNTRTTAKLTESTAHEYIKAKYPTCDFDFLMINGIYEKYIQEENVAYKEILKYICPKLKFDDPKPEPLPPLPPQSDNTSDILATTLPFGIAVALGSIAFLFLK